MDLRRRIGDCNDFNKKVGKQRVWLGQCAGQYSRFYKTKWLLLRSTWNTHKTLTQISVRHLPTAFLIMTDVIGWFLKNTGSYLTRYFQGSLSKHKWSLLRMHKFSHKKIWNRKSATTLFSIDPDKGVEHDSSPLMLHKRCVRFRHTKCIKWSIDRVHNQFADRTCDNDHLPQSFHHVQFFQIQRLKVMLLRSRSATVVVDDSCHQHGWMIRHDDRYKRATVADR